MVSNTLLNIELKNEFSCFGYPGTYSGTSLSKAFGRCAKSACKERGENCSNIKVISESTITIA